MVVSSSWFRFGRMSSNELQETVNLARVFIVTCLFHDLPSLCHDPHQERDGTAFPLEDMGGLLAGYGT